MKILFIASAILNDDPGISGAESRFIEIAKYWAKQGHEIHLLSSKGGFNLCSWLGLDVKLHSFKSIQGRNRWAHLLRLFEVIFRLPKDLFQQKFDVIYSSSEGAYDVLPGLFIKRKFPQTKWVVVVHWLPPFPPWKRTGSSVLHSTAFFLTERIGLRLALRFADRVLTVSEETGRQLEKIGISSRRYVAVKCGVQLKEIQNIAAQSFTPRPFEAIFMKRLQSVKGVFDLIDIWTKVIKEKPEAVLLVMGEGLEEEKMKRIVQDQGLTQNIRFLGAIYDFEQKFKYVTQAKLFLLPSHEENWAIVIGEALAAETPVICYDLMELRAVWKESCLFIEKGNIDAFANEILKLLDAPNKLECRQKEGLAFVQHFDWMQIAETELAIITQE
jgi:glycosyltransferase involved in cell wall biosynthesis